MPKLSRRDFLLIVTGSATATSLAGCRPDDAQPSPTLYAPGQVVPTSETNIQGQAIRPDARHGRVTYDQMRVTDNQYFYAQSYGDVEAPTHDEVLTDWALTIDGLVDQPLTLTYEALRQLPEIESMRTLECIGNPVGGSLIGNAVWSGFALQPLLDQAGIKSSATRARFYATDGYSTAVDLEWIMQPDVLMAYKMNGQLLPREHGYPLRILMPGLYGQKMPKWIERIEFIDHPYQGYWESRGWSDTASVQTNSIIHTPPHQSKIEGRAAIQGVAFAGVRLITAVDVRVDGGDWMPATLTQGETSMAWTQWYVLWTPPAAGTYEIEVRATDDTGFSQQTEAGGAFGNAKPRGTNAIHRIVIERV